MPNERRSVTHKFVFPGAHKETVFDPDGKPVIKQVDVKGYITAGVYSDGKLGEVFLTIGKQGGPWKVYECLMIAVSIGLQCGIPLSVFVDKFKHSTFEPFGVTINPDIPMAKSVVDYLFRWLEKKFPDGIMDGFDNRDDGKVDDGIKGCTEET
jgi:ribonucleoside-diphosphate reductase alpha chain